MVSDMKVGTAALVSLVVFLLFLSLTASAQESVPVTTQQSATRDQNPGPEVTKWSPQNVSVNSELQLEGYRLSADDASKATAYFIQNRVKFNAKTKGGWSTVNDALHGLQSQGVIVPEGLVSGPSQVILEVDGRSSVPITVTITEYRLPQPKGVNPKSGSPGTVVVLDCPDFHTSDVIVLTDATGKVTRIRSHGTGSTNVKVPQDAAEGALTIQIGNSQYFNNQLSEPVTFLVSTDLLPLELAPENITPVAPGQWLDLQVTNFEPLLSSELTEVNFKQSGRSIVVTAPNPHRPHIAVPTALSAGEVQLEVRTWRNGRASLWSDTVTIQLPEHVVAPFIDAIRLEKDNWVQLWPGPDRAKTFSASAGDVIVLHGSFAVADAKRLKATLIGPAGVIELHPYELDQKANWFGDVCVKLPDTLQKGDSRLVVADMDAYASVEVPIVIRIR